MDLSAERERLKAERGPEEDAWSAMTGRLEAIMRDLEVQARRLHAENLRHFFGSPRWHDARDVYCYLLT